MISWFRSSAEALPPADAARPSATLPVPLEQNAPASPLGWRDHIEGALASTVRSGTTYGAAVVSGAVESATRTAEGAIEVGGRLGRYGAETAGTALTVASGAAAGTVEVVGRAAVGATEVAGHVGRYGAESAGSALKVATHAVSGLGKVGGTVIDLAVISPTAAATRSAATVAEATIVKPAKAISRFVLIIVGIICGSAVAIAGFAALAMYFYHAGSSTHFAPSAPPPTVIVLQPGPANTPQVVTNTGLVGTAEPRR